MKHYTTTKNPQSTTHNLQEQLLEALVARDLKMFCALLRHPEVSPLHRYGPPHWLTCLEIASQNAGCEEFVTALLQSGVEPNINTIVWEPIHHAAAEGHANTLKVLLHDTRTKVNAVDNCGRTALHLAAKHFGHGEDVERYEYKK
jgi:ankyrin repeat protein